MIKRRFGEDFRTKLNDNLEIKAAEVAKKQGRDNRRKPRADGERKERKPRENKQKKEGEKVEGETQQPVAAEQTQEQKPAAPKREGRRRGGREGQQ